MVSTVGRTEQLWARFTPAERSVIDRARAQVPGRDEVSTSEYVREAAFVLAWLVFRHGSEYRQAIGAPIRGPIADEETA